MKIDNSFIEKDKRNFIYVSLLILLCLFSTLVNRIPADYIVMSGDKHFPVNIEKSYSRYYFEWGNFAGDGYITPGEHADILHNGFYYILNLFGLPDNQKQNVKYFLFLFFSGLSIYLSIGILFGKQVTPISKFILAIFYTFNHFTLDAATSMGIYFTYFDLYIFLPLIFTFFLRGIIDRKMHFLILSGIFVMFSVGGFNSPAFLIVLFLLLGITILCCWILGIIKLKQVFISIPVFILFLMLISFYILPYLNSLYSATIIGQSQNFEDLKRWILWQSTPVLELFRFSRGYPIFPKFYPYNNPFQGLFTLLSFYPIIIISLAFLLVRKKRNWLLILSGILFIIFIFGSAKATLSEGLSYFIFALPVLWALRSSDKFFIVLPLITSIFLYYLLEECVQKLKSNKIRILFYSIIAGIILMYPAPFYLGKFHQNVSINHVWGYKYDTMVKTPEYYKDLANYVNSDKSYSKILSMPYTGQIGIGWVLYPKWKYIGVDYTTLYFNNPVFSPVDTFGQFRYAKYLHQNPDLGGNTLVNLARLRGIRYLIVNKDVDDEYIVSFRKSFEDAEEDFIFVNSFGNLELYRMLPDRELPVIYNANLNIKKNLNMQQSIITH